jgi:poly(A) polymerase
MSGLLAKLPCEVQKILKIFGADICLVGGAVRDLLLNKTTSDYDFCSLLAPKQVQEKLLQHHIKSLDINAKYGTIIALVGNFQLQITTARTEKNFTGRACEVEFGKSNYQQDAGRRDFTINALYLNFCGEVLDFYNGKQHLAERKIEFIGDAKARIYEDHLRILRFFRFNIYYSNHYQPKQLAVCLQYSLLLGKISKPRIREEMLKILLSFNYHQPIFAYLNDLADFTGWRLQIAVLQKVVAKTKPKETDILLALAVLDANFDLNKMANILCLTRAEKKLFYHLQNHRKILQNLDQSNIVCQLILVALNIKGDYLQKLLLFLWAENILSDADYENFLAKSKVWQQKTLPISIEDLINIGVSKQHLSQSLQQLKKIWAEQNLLLNKEQLLDLFMLGRNINL